MKPLSVVAIAFARGHAASAGTAWVRFAIWDVAGNGAFVQPVWLK